MKSLNSSGSLDSLGSLNEHNLANLANLAWFKCLFNLHMLGCWVVGLLGCWVVGLLGCWVAGLLGCWVAGLLGCWDVGLHSLTPAKRYSCSIAENKSTQFRFTIKKAITRAEQLAENHSGKLAIIVSAYVDTQ